MTIKVCHLTSAHPSTDVRIFYKECSYLAKEKDLYITLVAPGESRRENEVTVIGVGEKPRSRFKRMFTFTKLVYRVALEQKADIYHFHDPELLGAGLKLKRLGKKVVFDSHEYTYEQIRIKTYIPRLARNIIAKLFHMYETRICSKLDAVIFPCAVNGKHPFENRASRILYVDNFPALAEFDNINSVEKTNDVCHIGSLDEDRGITCLLKGIKIANCRLVLGGVFASPEYQKSLKNAGLLDNVDYKGFCDRETVYSIYASSKIGISTILPRGQYTMLGNLPTKIYENMAMGMPVVISDFDYAKHVLEKYKLGIAVNSENPDEIADAINMLLNNDEIRNEMGKEGRRAVEEEFNWESEVEKIVKLYNELYKKTN